MFKAEQPTKPTQGVTQGVTQGITINSNVPETIIGPETKYQGTVTTSKTIRIDGLFEGEIKSGGHVIVGEEGKFKGTMDCTSLYISGIVEGTMTVSGRLECTEHAVLKGDVVVKELILAPGTIFDGTCNMSKFNPTATENKPE